MSIFSYVVTHDTGFAPNPFGGFLTLATCKPRIRKSAGVGDWLVGTGSVRNVGNERVIYVAQVGWCVSLADYGSDPRFQVKLPSVSSSEPWRIHGDNIYELRLDGWHQRRNPHHGAKHLQHDVNVERVLVAPLFWYFGASAPPIPSSLRPVVKAGPGHRRERSPALATALADWINQFPSGLSGEPWGRAPRQGGRTTV